MADFNPPLHSWPEENESFAVLYDEAQRRSSELAYQVQDNRDHMRRLEKRHSAAWEIEKARLAELERTDVRP